MNVKGLSIEDITSLSNKDFNSLSRSELAKVTSRLVSASNKRLRRLEKQGITTPSSESVAKSGGAFSVKGKNINELRAEFSRAKTFLGQKTSTVSGYKKFKKEYKQLTGFNLESLTKEQQGDLWKLTTALKEIEPVKFYKMNYKQRLNYVSNVFTPNESFENMRDRLNEKVNEEYEQYTDISDTSDWFDI